MSERRKGRPPRELVERARALATEGKSPEEIAAAIGARPRAVKRWLKAPGQAALPSAESNDSPPPSTPPAATPEAAVEDAFGPDPETAPPPTEKGDGFNDPLSDVGAEPLTTAEIIGMADMGLKLVDGGLVLAFPGGAPARGLDEGQRGFLKVFGKRISAAIQTLGPVNIEPKDVLLLTVAVLVAPRLVERIGGSIRRRRSARGTVSGRAEDGQDARGDRMGASDREEAPVPAAGG